MRELALTASSARPSFPNGSSRRNARDHWPPGARRWPKFIPIRRNIARKRLAYDEIFANQLP
jgi:hypothetical protein